MVVLITENTELERDYYYIPVERREILYNFLRQAEELNHGISISIHISALFLQNDDIISSHSRARIFEYSPNMGDIVAHLKVFLRDLRNRFTHDTIGSNLELVEFQNIYLNIIEMNYNNHVNEDGADISDDDGIETEDSESDSESEISNSDTESDYGITTSEDDDDSSSIDEEGLEFRKGITTCILGAIAKILYILPPNRVRILPREVMQFWRHTRFFKFLYKQFYLGEINIRNYCIRYHYNRQIIIYDNLGYCIAATERGNINLEPLLLYKKSNDRYYPITDLRLFLNVRTHQNVYYCRTCFKFHVNNCPLLRTIIVEEERVTNKDKPNVKTEWIVSADFESYVINENHKLLSYAFVSYNKHINNGDLIRRCSTKIENYNLEEEFLTELFNLIRRYQRNTIIDFNPKNCSFCNKELTTITTVTGFNYKIGRWAKMHRYCRDGYDNYLVVYFHFFKGYDINLIIHYLVNQNIYDLNVFAKNINKIETIRLIHKHNPNIRIIFKDSFDLFYASVDSISSIIEYYFTPQDLVEAFNGRKGIYPYKWMNNYTKLNNAELPMNPEDWYNDLTNEIDNYEQAQEIYHNLNCQSINDFTKFYNIFDCYVMLEAIFIFNEKLYNKYNINCTDFLGIPSISWYCAINFCRHPIYTVPNETLFNDIQNGIRGGVSQVMHKYSDLNQFSDIVMLDVNNMYGSILKNKKLPNKFISNVDVNNEIEFINEIINTDWDNSDYIYILKVNLEYPRDLHDTSPHNQFPLAPQRYNGMLCTTLFNKKDYLILAKNLKFYIQKGLIVSKIHYCTKWEQNYLFNEFVSYNHEQRQLTNNKIEKNMYKLMNNAVYGKTCENIGKYKNIRIIELEDEEREYGMLNPEIHNALEHLNIGQNSAVCSFPVVNLKAKKPIQLGFAVLEEAKLMMYDFIYNHINNVFPIYQLIYTDTDSLIIGVPNLDNNETILRKLKDANAPVDYNEDAEGNELPPTKEIGLWSNEAAEYNFNKITEVIALSAKCYIVNFNNTFKTRMKGIKKSAKLENNQSITIEYFKQALNNKNTYIKQAYFHRKNYNIKTKQMHKLALNNNDNKRISYGVYTYPLGYQGTNRELRNLVNNNIVNNINRF